MIRVTFVTSDGVESGAEATEGLRLLDIAQADGQPLEGTCGGDMACGTCHVIVDPEHFAALPVASESEEDMLDLVAGATRTSRLSCQIRVTEALDGAVLRVPFALGKRGKAQA